MKNNKSLPILIFAFVSLLVVYASFYTVNEGYQAIALRLGDLVKNQDTSQPKIMKAGLHMRLPFIDHIKRFDTRLQSFDVKSSRILTKEQKYILVDYYVKCQISNLPIYYKRTGGFREQAYRLLEQKINNTLRAAFGHRSISEVLSGQRDDIMTLLKQKANEGAESLGITVLDVRIKRTDLPKEVSASVFSRMRTEREQVATKHRSNGRSQAEFVKAKADAAVTIILATAKAKAANIRAQGIAKAAEIYNNAYEKNLDFYKFWKSLAIISHGFGSGDVLLIDKNNPLIKRINHEQ